MLPMAETRPSGRPLVPDDEALVAQHVAEIDSRGRLHVLRRWTQRTNWPPFPTAGDFEILVVLSERGRASLRPWHPGGPKILQRYQELTASEDGPDLEALRRLQDRYARLSLPRERRPHLGDSVLQHLGLPLRREMSTPIYVVVLPDRLDLLGPAYRDRVNEQGHPALDGLP